MAPRIGRNNGDAPFFHDWNGRAILPGELSVVDDDSEAVRLAVEAGELELDPTLGRHYQAPPTERRIRPTERDAGKASGPRPGQ